MAEKLNHDQVLRATTALLKYVQMKLEEESAKNLLVSDAIIWLTITLKRIPEKAHVKPIRMGSPIVHPLLGTDSRVCLITKDTQEEHQKLLESKNVKNIDAVISVTRLQKNYKTFETKRLLCDEYSLFLGDDRVLPMLSKLLGRTFYLKKKLPAPVDLTKANLALEINSAINATYMSIPAGACLAVKIGHSGFSAEQIAENIEVGMAKIAEKIPKKWKNIQSISIRTSDSLALPIWNVLPDDVGVINTEQ